MNGIYKDHWQSYLKLGLIPYPASKNSKSPIVPWNDDLPAPCSDDYAEWEEKYPDANIWVFLGEGFAVIDPDGPGAEDFVKGLNLPDGPTSVSGNKSVHRWFKVSSPLNPVKVRNGTDQTFLELRTGNLGMFAPPSIHPETKKAYKWKEGLSPWEITFSELPLETYEKIKALLPKPESKPETRMMPAQTGNNSLGSLDLERYLNHYGVKFSIKQDTGRTIYPLDRCPFADQHTAPDNPGDSSIIQGADGKLGYQCFHNHCSSKTWQDARKAISGDDLLVQFHKDYTASSQKHEKGKENLAEHLRLWLDECYGTFTIEQVYKELGITDPRDKNLVRVTLYREVERGKLEKGRVMGQYTVVEDQAESIEILDEKPTPLSIKYPAKIEEYVNTYSSNVVVVAGSPNAGKSAFAFNTAILNKDQFEVFYWSSEMGSEEITLRTMESDYPAADWKKIIFKRRTHDFHQIIKPDALNIVDYLEVIEGKFYLIGDDIRKIYERLNKGIALICLQMDKGATYAWGGQKSTDKARIYVTLDGNKLTVIKAKNWASKRNPNGLVRSFKLHNGIKFVWDQWE